MVFCKVAKKYRLAAFLPGEGYVPTRDFVLAVRIEPRSRLHTLNRSGRCWLSLSDVFVVRRKGHATACGPCTQQLRRASWGILIRLRNTAVCIFSLAFFLLTPLYHLPCVNVCVLPTYAVCIHGHVYMHISTFMYANSLFGSISFVLTLHASWGAFFCTRMDTSWSYGWVNRIYPPFCRWAWFAVEVDHVRKANYRVQRLRDCLGHL